MEDAEIKYMYDINTFQCKDNEVFIGCKYYSDKGDEKDITLVFSNFQLLEWLDTYHMKKELNKFIESL